MTLPAARTRSQTVVGYLRTILVVRRRRRDRPLPLASLCCIVRLWSLVQRVWRRGPVTKLIDIFERRRACLVGRPRSDNSAQRQLARRAEVAPQ